MCQDAERFALVQEDANLAVREPTDNDDDANALNDWQGDEDQFKDGDLEDAGFRWASGCPMGKRGATSGRDLPNRSPAEKGLWSDRG